MMPDLRRAKIRPPRGDEWPALCRMLTEVWPVERWLWDGVRSGEIDLYRWRSMCMFLDDTVLGSVSRIDITIRLKGRPVVVAGIGAVTTAAAYRRMGIAKRLLTEILKDVDRDGLPSALFTDLPRVYESSGFHAVAQDYPALSTGQIPINAFGLHAEQIETLDDLAIQRMARVYSGEYPDYDGKVVRDPDYWKWYGEFFNHAQGKRIIICRCGDSDLGYVRVEGEPDRMLVSEFCCAPGDAETARALLSFAQEAAVGRGLKLITLALPQAHFLWDLLRRNQVPSEPETGARRESFMVRGPKGREPTELGQFNWSLGDKF